MSSADIRNIAAHAFCTSPDGPYQTTIDSARGQRIRLRQESERGVFHAVANGDVAWTIDEENGAVEMGGASLVQAVRNHDFHMLAFEPERVATVRLDAEGRLLGFVASDSRDPTVEIGIDVQAWTPLLGHDVPSLVVISAAEGAFTLDFDNVEANVVDERIFDPPTA